VFGLVLVLFGGFTAWMISQSEWWRVTRRLRTTPRRPIAGLGEGERARIVGTVRALDTCAAPITGRACVYWQVIVSAYQPSKDSDGNDTSGYQSVLSRGEGSPFLVEDASGRALVDPQDATVSLVHDVRDTGDERTSMFLARHGVSAAGQNLRYSEAVIAPGEVIAVAGAGVREPDPEAAGGGYRDAPTRLRIAASPRVPLLISDRPETTE